MNARAVAILTLLSIELITPHPAAQTVTVIGKTVPIQTTVSGTGPGSVQAVSPMNGATNVPITTPLVCTAAGATSFVLSANGGNWGAQTQSTCNFTLPTPLVTTAGGQGYSWTVTASNSFGNAVGTFSFTLQQGFYVSTTGNDGTGTGTFANPWRTINHGLPLISSGQTLWVRGGTYNEAICNQSEPSCGSPIIVPSGTSLTATNGVFLNAPVLASYPGETATIQGGNGQAEVQLDNFTTVLHHFVFDRLTLDAINNTNAGISGALYLAGGTHDIVFQNGEIKNGWVNCIQTSINNSTIGNYSGLQILNSHVHDCGLNPAQSNSGYPFYAISDGNILQGSELDHGHGYGYHLNNCPTQSVNNQVIDNRIHDNQITVAGGASSSFGVALLCSTGTRVVNNLIYNNGQSGACGGCQAGGIFDTTNSIGDVLLNNTIFNNTEECILFQSYGGTNTAENNLCWHNGSGIIDAGGTGSPSLITNLNPVNQTTGSGGSDPLFVNPGLSPPDLHIQSGSPARTGGTTNVIAAVDFDGVARPQGATYSRGAYEFAVGAPPPPMITRNATATANGVTGTLTIPFTCAAACPTTGALVVFVRYGATGGTITNDLTSVTYNGVPVTQLDAIAARSSTEWEYSYLLMAPAAGTHNIVITSSVGTNQIIADAVSYLGVRQSSEPDAHGFDLTNQNTNVASDTISLTTQTSNAWMMLFVVQNSNQSVTAGTGSFLALTGSDGSDFVFDTNGPLTPAGSHSMTVATSPASTFIGVYLALASL
jgi:hypothetical protein